MAQAEDAQQAEEAVHAQLMQVQARYNSTQQQQPNTLRTQTARQPRPNTSLRTTNSNHPASQQSTTPTPSDLPNDIINEILTLAAPICMKANHDHAVSNRTLAFVNLLLINKTAFKIGKLEETKYLFNEVRRIIRSLLETVEITAFHVMMKAAQDPEAPNVDYRFCPLFSILQTYAENMRFIPASRNFSTTYKNRGCSCATPFGCFRFPLSSYTSDDGKGDAGDDALTLMPQLFMDVLVAAKKYATQFDRLSPDWAKDMRADLRTKYNKWHAPDMETDDWTSSKQGAFVEYFERQPRPVIRHVYAQYGNCYYGCIASRTNDAYDTALLELYESIQCDSARGGGGRSGGAPSSHSRARNVTPRARTAQWVASGRTVVTEDGVRRALYSRNATSEPRVRRVRARDGVRRVVYERANFAQLI
jgi:hypothetical protein